jgi:hypothetical protein
VLPAAALLESAGETAMETPLDGFVEFTVSTLVLPMLIPPHAVTDKPRTLAAQTHACFFTPYS